MTRDLDTERPDGPTALAPLIGAMACIVGLTALAWLVWRASAGEGVGFASSMSPLTWVLIALFGSVVWWVLRRQGRERHRVQRALHALREGQSPPRLSIRPDSEFARLSLTLETIGSRLKNQANRISLLEKEREAVLGVMDGAVLVLDASLRIERLNRAAEWMLHVGEPAARGRLLHEVIREADLIRFVSSAQEHEALQVTEVVLRSEPERRVRASGSRLTDADGRIVGLLIVLTDVTQLRRLEAVRSDFAANVSHELRTPITNIRGYIETLLESGLEDKEQSLEFVRIIARNAERLSAIVEDMLTLTTLEESSGQESGADAVDRLDVDHLMLRDVVDASIGDLEGEARAQEMQIVNDVAGDLDAHINPTLIQQAITNLLSNAIRYSPEGTRVWIRSDQRREGERPVAVISIVDEGPGIPEQHLARLFERFYRVDRARSREAGGTGLGLAIVKHIAQLHGGRVEAESQEGRGSTFRLILPRSEPVSTDRPRSGEDRTVS